MHVLFFFFFFFFFGTTLKHDSHLTVFKNNQRHLAIEHSNNYQWFYWTQAYMAYMLCVLGPDNTST